MYLAFQVQPGVPVHGGFLLLLAAVSTLTAVSIGRRWSYSYLSQGTARSALRTRRGRSLLQSRQPAPVKGKQRGKEHTPWPWSEPFSNRAPGEFVSRPANSPCLPARPPQPVEFVSSVSPVWEGMLLLASTSVVCVYPK